MAVSLGKSGQSGPQEPRNPYEAFPAAPATDSTLEPTGPDAMPYPPLPASAVTGHINDADLLRHRAGKKVSPELLQRVLHLFDAFVTPRPELDLDADFEHILQQLLAAFNGSEEDALSFVRCALIIFSPLPYPPRSLNYFSKKAGRCDLPMGPVFAPGTHLADIAYGTDEVSALRYKSAALTSHLAPGFSALIALHGASKVSTEHTSPDASTQLVERITSYATDNTTPEDSIDSDEPPVS